MSGIRHLRAIGEIVRVSSLYETEPVEVTNQPWFLNCAVALNTALSPRQLLTAVLQIESEMGRQRTRDKGPRTLDMDILIFRDVILKDAGLTIPHPAMADRRFVLEPMAEIAADLLHPVLQKTIQQLRDALPSGQTVRKIPSTVKER